MFLSPESFYRVLNCICHNVISILSPLHRLFNT
jgi:hypothetical protein